MDEMILRAFVDELTKIASGGNSVTMSAGTMQTPKAPNPVSSTISSGAQPAAKSTNYSVVHNQSPMVAVGTADPAKAVPPMPVRA